MLYFGHLYFYVHVFLLYLLKNSQINQHPVNRKDITDTKGCEGT